MDHSHNAYPQEILKDAVQNGTEPEPFQVRFRAPLVKASTSGSNTPNTTSRDFTTDAKCIPTARQEVLLFVHIKRQFTTGLVDQLVLVCRDMSTQAVRPNCPLTCAEDKHAYNPLSRSLPILRGRACCVQTLMREVSARERDCEELMEHSSSAMFSVNTEGRINGWNSAMERISGVAQSTVMGLSLLGEVLGPSGVLVHVPYGANVDAMTELYALLVNVLALETNPALPPTAAPELLNDKDQAGSQRQSMDEMPRKSMDNRPPQLQDGAAMLTASPHSGDAAINVRFVKAGHASSRSVTGNQVRHLTHP